MTMTTVGAEPSIQQNRMTRQEMLDALRSRDGNECKFPSCKIPLDFNAPDFLEDGRPNPMVVTIDHWYPQYWCKQEGWTQDQIWDLFNLKLMHKQCNAKKGDRIPNEDGSIPEKATRRFRYRREKRAGRPELCMSCDNGHNLGVGEVCASCGCDAQRFPREAKVRYQDCDHEVYWCWICSITPEMRPPSMGTAMRQADSDEDGEDYDPDESHDAPHEVFEE